MNDGTILIQSGVLMITGNLNGSAEMIGVGPLFGTLGQFPILRHIETRETTVDDLVWLRLG